MKQTLQLCTFMFCAALFAGCSKTNEVPITSEQQVINNLTGNGNKVWRLTKTFVNSVEQTLTSDQLKYTKTYSISPAQTLAGTFTNTDGNNGKWALNGLINLIEVIQNNLAGPVQISYIINGITENTLDIEYSTNFKTVRELYNGY